MHTTCSLVSASVFIICRFKVEDELKYLNDARDLIRPERSTLKVSFLDIEEHSTKLATIIEEQYYQ